MLTNPTLDKLQRLRLTGMYEAYREQLESTRLQILQQTATAQLAQANVAPQNVLALFQ